ncbi:F-box/LRR-repeat protein fbxl-1-like [Topomyia yanbarensis]|uniref:F-box/LRR-repeat protein fbxl-1-like n=1 Tax=Topomyia yanbarensis TaxID=2498891 RepID=UPI00273BCC72|nr:F-box/LRR-repeat protein fbxl-1-like [Topomyia yanbarensis]
MAQYNLDDFGPRYSDLPMEILVKIFRYLNVGDRFAVGLTCKRWLEATQYQLFVNDICLNLHKTYFSDSTSPVRDLLRSSRNFQNIVLSQVEFNGTELFFSRFGKHIYELSLKACDIREKSFYGILVTVPNIRVLRIEGCRELLMSGRLFESAKEQKLTHTLHNVSTMSLAYGRYLSDALFRRIVSLTPNLENLDLSGCSISFHKGLYRKFYPTRSDDASESVLTFHYISQFIEYQAEKLKMLNFSSTLIDGDSLETLAGIDKLHLDTLDLNSCDQLTNSGIAALAQNQNSLQHLNFSKSVRFTDACLQKICVHLPNLKSIKLRRCRALTDLGIKELVQLQKLQVLDISECESVTGQGIIKGIASAPNSVLLELYVSALNLCESSVMRIAENFPSLRVLDLSYCFHSVSDRCLQMIFKNMVWLRHLNLDYCDKISDRAMTGVGMLLEVQETSKTTAPNPAEPSTQYVEEIDPQPSTSGRSLLGNQPDEPFKISIRSKAEQEIVNDAMRKRAMMEMCQQNELLKDEAGSDFSIDSLKGLRVLRLSQCNKLSDISLMYAFKLKELKEISLSKCQQISIEGIRSLAHNCPSLEIVDLSECHNINDKAIELLAIHLKRLQTLSLERCFQLSDFSLDYIAIHCKALRTLDVRGCRNMCAEPNLRLANVPTLRTVHMSKPGPYVGEPGYFVKKPAPPPMPKRI